MPYIRKVTLPTGSTYEINNYRGKLGTGGDITTLPTASADNKGDVYEVITAGTYASKAAVVDDLFYSDGVEWKLVQTHDTTYQTTNTVTEGSTALVTSGGVWDAISELPRPMVFKGTVGVNGTITTLPVDGSATVGDTYKVITDGTYAGIEAKVGDTFICETKSASANTWAMIPSGDDVEDTWRDVKVNDVEVLGNGISTGALNLVDGTNTTVTFDGTDNSIQINATDTNTHRPVKIGGTEILGDNTTPLDLIAGANITLTPGTGADEGKVVINGTGEGTTYTFTEGSTDGAFTVTPSDGNAQSVPIHHAVTDVEYDNTNAKFKKTIGGMATDIATVSTTSVPNVTSVGAMPTYSVANETLTITSGTTPTLGTAINVVDGFTAP